MLTVEAIDALLAPLYRDEAAFNRHYWETSNDDLNEDFWSAWDDVAQQIRNLQGQRLAVEEDLAVEEVPGYMNVSDFDPFETDGEYERRTGRRKMTPDQIRQWYALRP